MDDSGLVSIREYRVIFILIRLNEIEATIANENP